MPITSYLLLGYGVMNSYKHYKRTLPASQALVALLHHYVLSLLIISSMGTLGNGHMA